MKNSSSIRAWDVFVYDFFYALDHFLSRKFVNLVFGPLRVRLRERFLRRIRQHTAVVRGVERRKNLDPKEFIERYLVPGIPVVLEGAARDWPCVKKWNFDYLNAVCNADAVTLLPKDRTTDGFQGTREAEAVEKTTFDQFIAGLNGGSGKYLRFSTIVEDHKVLQADMDPSWLQKYFGRWSLGHRVHAFIGSSGSRTRLHCDFPPNLFTQVVGKKHWVLFEPHYRTVIDPLLERSSLSFTTNLEVRGSQREQDPLSQHMNRYETTLEPGDVLFNPAYMWHDVINESDSIGVSIRWLTPGVHFRASWVMQILNLCATNPPIWRAGLSKRDINKDLLGSKNNAKKDKDYVG